jgi:hypothetical protein
MVAAGPVGAAERASLSQAETVLLRALVRDLGRLQRDAGALRLALLPYLIDMARLEAERELRAAEEEHPLPALRGAAPRCTSG